MDYFPFAFTGLVEHHDLGTYRYTVLWLPDEIAGQLPLAEHPRLRISGELNDQPCTGAWQPSRGRWYLMLGKPLLKATGLSVDCFATLRFRVEPQDEVDMPPLLAQALEGNRAAAERWAMLTPGKQRAICHHVLSAKTGATVARRIAQAVLWLETQETDLRQLPKMKTDDG
ncbi:YdeI/OmpD-associated family protein [Sphingobium algorifonticola]|nr:YdeI/OmpD-associated family protein [Sphingobium algorifonticola]